MYSNRKGNYIQRLLAQDKRIFTVDELDLVWDMNDRNTLNTLCKRYQQQGKLFRLARGIYSYMPIDKLDLFEVGMAIAGPLSYVSTESILAREGIISQAVRKITLIGKKQKEFRVGGNEYICRYMAPKRLVDRQGIVRRENYEIATKQRAISDIKVINPQYYFDNRSV